MYFLQSQQVFIDKNTPKNFEKFRCVDNCVGVVIFENIVRCVDNNHKNSSCPQIVVVR